MEGNWAVFRKITGTDGKESACIAGDIRDAGSIPGSGRSPKEGNGYPLQYSWLSLLTLSHQDNICATLSIFTF